jgi:hypothetical protein
LQCRLSFYSTNIRKENIEHEEAVFSMLIHKIFHASESFVPQYLLHERQDLLQEKDDARLSLLLPNLQTRYSTSLKVSSIVPVLLCFGGVELPY